MSAILTKFKSKFSSYEMVSDRGGKFEVSVDGKLLYSKLDTGEFPKDAKIVSLVEKHLKAAT